MRKEYALDFWRTYLPYALSGSDDTVTNPAIEFTRQAKAGGFDSLSDEEYDIRLQDVEEASKLFLNKSKCNTIGNTIGERDHRNNKDCRKCLR